MGFLTRLRNYFIAGILVFAPVSITVWLVWKIMGAVDNAIRPLVPVELHPDTYLPFPLPGLGIVVVIVCLCMIGYLASGVIGRLFFKSVRWVLSKIPVVSSILGWSEQIFETLLSEDSTAFREVVVIEYPYRNCWAVGFITGETKGQIQDLTDEKVYNVFVPATPNPTTGFLLFVPEPDIQRIDLSVDDGIKLVISGGIVKPPSEEAAHESAWGHGTLIGDDLERIRAQVEREADQTFKWGREGVFGDEMDKIRSEYGDYDTGAMPGLLTQFRDLLVAGTLVTVPVALPIWIAVQAIAFFDNSVVPLIPTVLNPETYLPFPIPGLGLITAIVTMIVLGFLSAGFFGGIIIKAGEHLIEGLPVVRGLYSAMKQIAESLFKKQSNAFREVVLVQYPRPDAWAIGFVTGSASRSIQPIPEREFLNIFLPTTPNPTSGFLLFLPREETHPLSMTVEEGLKMVVSGGIVTPEAAEDAAEDAKKEQLAH